MFVQIKDRLISRFNHMLSRTWSMTSPFYSILLGLRFYSILLGLRFYSILLGLRFYSILLGFKVLFNPKIYFC